MKLKLYTVKARRLKFTYQEPQFFDNLTVGYYGPEIDINLIEKLVAKELDYSRLIYSKEYHELTGKPHHDCFLRNVAAMERATSDTVDLFIKWTGDDLEIIREGADEIRKEILAEQARKREAELTEDYIALYETLTPEQQRVVIKKLMRGELQ